MVVLQVNMETGDCKREKETRNLLVEEEGGDWQF
jgi:hypothetical protein